MNRIAKNLKAQLVGTQFETPADGTGTVTDVRNDKGVVWIFVTIPGGGFNGSQLKTAVRAA